MTIERYFRIDVFTAVIYFQLESLNNKFSEHVVKLIILNSSKHKNKLFEIDYICNLVDKFYPQNFIEFPILSPLKFWPHKTVK
jgi:hypothetical protein